MRSRSSLLLLRELLRERFEHGLRRVAADVAAVRRDLADERRADEAVVRARREEDGVDLRREVGVRVGDLELVLEVGGDTQATDDDAGALLHAVLDEEAVEVIDGDVREVLRDLLNEVLAL